jgi:tRNA1(Val) A37 N6-methylase TrmN6
MLTVSLEDNMALMKRYEDKHFDLAIVDPPYFDGPKSLVIMVQALVRLVLFVMVIIKLVLGMFLVKSISMSCFVYQSTKLYGVATIMQSILSLLAE